MSCDISPTGECGRGLGQIYNCQNCSEFQTHALSLLESGDFVLVTSDEEKSAAVHRKRDGCMVMAMKGGKFRKGTGGV